jgi:hypothetical protein
MPWHVPSLAEGAVTGRHARLTTSFRYGKLRFFAATVKRPATGATRPIRYRYATSMKIRHA